MRQVPFHLRALVRVPWVWAAGAGIAGGGLALLAVPLLATGGYELALGLCVLVGLLGGVMGIAAARGGDLTDPGVRHRVGAAWALNCAAAAIPALAALLWTSLASACDPLANVAYLPLLVLPSALLAAAVGTLSGIVARGFGRAYLLYLGAVAGSLAVTAQAVLGGPQVFAYNHLLGFIPGPLYDEALVLRPALWWFQAGTLLWALAAAGLASVLWRRRRAGGGWRGARRAGVPLALALCLELSGGALGFRASDASVQRALGGRRESERMILFHPREKPPAEVERLMRDLEFRYAQLAAFLGEAPQSQLRVYLHRSAEEKQALVGAGRTQFAKPWRREVHLNDLGFPHPTLKHELAHVMAAPFADGLFGVPAAFGLMPHMAVVEGLAVAADDPVDELTLHEWAAGMRRQGLAPDLRQLLTPSGFYAAAAGRAYTQVGSFLRHLADTRGQARLRAAYARGDLALAYGVPVDDLVGEWEAFVDALPLDEAALQQAFSRFRRGSLFERPCAREVAGLHQRAVAALAQEPDAALRLFGRCAALQPEEPLFRLGQVAAWQRLGQPEPADRMLEQLAREAAQTPSLLAEVLSRKADAALLRRDLEAARRHLQALLALSPPPAAERTARVKLAALDAPEAAEAIFGFFSPVTDELRLLALREAVEVAPGSYAPHYLLGRRALQLGAASAALPHLERTLTLGPPASISRETHRLLFQARLLTLDCAGLAAGALEEDGWDRALLAEAREWRERCEFEKQTFKAPLEAAAPFR